MKIGVVEITKALKQKLLKEINKRNNNMPTLCYHKTNKAYPTGAVTFIDYSYSEGQEQRYKKVWIDGDSTNPCVEVAFGKQHILMSELEDALLRLQKRAYSKKYNIKEEVEPVKEQKRFSKNYPCCKNCANRTVDVSLNMVCGHYKEHGDPKPISSFTLLMNYKFKPKSCKAFVSKNK